MGEDAAFQRVCAELGAAAERTIDLGDSRRSHAAPPLDVVAVTAPRPQPSGRGLVVARMRPSIFIMNQPAVAAPMGAEVVEFSPSGRPSSPRPMSMGSTWVGGIRVFAKGLSGNVALMASLRRAHQAGMPIYAECGGLMYLVEAIQDAAGARYAMVGLLPGICRLTDRCRTLAIKSSACATACWARQACERGA